MTRRPREASRMTVSSRMRQSQVRFRATRSRCTGLKRLALDRILKAEPFGRLGRARIPDVVDLARHLSKGLACFESLSWHVIHLQDQRAFQHVDKSWGGMRVPACRRAWRDIAHPNMHLAVLHLAQLGLEKVRSLDRLLLCTGRLTSNHTQCHSREHAQDRQTDCSAHGCLLCSAQPGGALVHLELVSTGCITLFTTYSPILSPIAVPTRVEER